MRRGCAVALAAVLALSPITGCKILARRGAGDAGAGRGLLSTLATLVGFEGEIELAFKGPVVGLLGPKPPAILLTVKGDRVRMEVSLGSGPLGGATIVDGAAKRSYTLVDPTKQYSETDLSTLSASATTAPRSAPFVKTGAKATIAGYECEVAEQRQPTGRIEVCTSNGIAFWGLGVGPFAKMLGGVGSSILTDLGGFPLRFLSYDASGALQVGFEATRIEKKGVPDSSFEIPAGYTKIPSPSSPGTRTGTGGPP